MLFREIIAVYCENHTEHINTLWAKFRVFEMLKQMVHIVTVMLQQQKRMRSYEKNL
jgi:hypothetical protein